MHIHTFTFTQFVVVVEGVVVVVLVCKADGENLSKAEQQASSTCEHSFRTRHGTAGLLAAVDDV